MLILKGHKTCVVIDNREERPHVDHVAYVTQRFLSKIVDDDLINRVEVYHNKVLVETINNGVEGGLTGVDSLKYLNLN